MPERITIAGSKTASGGAEDDYTIFTVPSGNDFILKKFIVAFPSGTDGELEISVKRSLQTIIPYSGVITGSAMSFEITEEEEFSEGTPVVIHYKNTNATANRTAYFLLEGELD